MRDLLTDLTLFDKQIEKLVTRMVRTDVQELSKRVVASSNSRVEHLTFFFLKDCTLMDYIRLSIVSWYLPAEVRSILQVDLYEKIKQLSSEDKFLIEILLSSKATMLVFLEETNLWHTRDFFGNVINSKFSLDRFFKISPYSRKVKRLQRKRGYHDHGHLAPEHKWKPRSDFSFTDLQNEIEQKRKAHDDTLLVLLSYLGKEG